MGSRVPEPNGARQVFTPALKHIKRMAEKSDQERRIDGIIIACEEMLNSVSEIDYRLSFYRLMEKIVVVTEEIEKYIERSKNELLINIDKGFSYTHKANILENMLTILSKPRTLMLKLEERNAPLLEYDDVINTKYIKESTKRYIPYDDDKNMESIDESKFMGVYEKIGIKNLISQSNIQLFINRAISGLVTKMNELERILHVGNKALYPALYEKYFGGMKFNQAMVSIEDDFNLWREEHDATVEDSKWQKKILDHINTCIVDLLKSDFLVNYENTLTEEDKEKYREECKKIKCISEEQTELYLNLRDMVEISIDKKGVLKYKPDAKKIGRHLYKNRNVLTPESHHAFIMFLANLQIHRDALLAKPDKEKLDYETPRFQFKKLLNESKWIGKVLGEGYNENYFDQFVDELMKSKYRDDIAKTWQKPKSRERLKAHLLGSLLRAEVLIGSASEIARLYIGKDNQDSKNFGDYILEGKKNTKCKFSDWVDDYVKGKV